MSGAFFTVNDADPRQRVLSITTASARIGDIEALAEELRELVAGTTSDLVLDVSAVRESDVSFHQLLVALERELADSGRRLWRTPLASDHPVTLTSRALGIALAGSPWDAGGGHGL